MCFTEEWENKEAEKGEREEKRSSMKVTPFLYRWVIKYCIEWLDLSYKIIENLKRKYSRPIRIIEGNRSPHIMTNPSTHVEVGEEWLKEHLSAEDKAKIIAERILHKPRHEDPCSLAYYPIPPIFPTVIPLQRIPEHYDIIIEDDYVAKIINP